MRAADERESRLSYRYLLLVRFALVNIVATALLIAAWLQGWLDGLSEETTLLLSAIVFAVFLYGLAISTMKVWETSAALNIVKSGGAAARALAKRYMYGETSGPTRDERIGMMRLKLGHKVQIVRQVANMLVFLGLIGTVIGFIIALSGVQPDAVSNADSVATMVATLIKGMSVALYTTLIGAVLNVWLNVNHRILATGTVNLMSEIVALGEPGDTA
jgi:hypothetical protein